MALPYHLRLTGEENPDSRFIPHGHSPESNSSRPGGNFPVRTISSAISILYKALLSLFGPLYDWSSNSV